MSTSSNNWQKKGKDGMGNAGERKEMVKDWHVQQLYVDKLCVDKLCGQVVTSCVWTRCASQCQKRQKCQKCQACHLKGRQMSPSPTRATQDARRCHQVPRLPRKEPRRPRRHLGTKRATSASPVPLTRLPRKVTVDVTKSHARRAGCTSMSPSATLATQKSAEPTASSGNQTRHQCQPSAISATPSCVGASCLWRSGV